MRKAETADPSFEDVKPTFVRPCDDSSVFAENNKVSNDTYSAIMPQKENNTVSLLKTMLLSICFILDSPLARHMSDSF